MAATQTLSLTSLTLILIVFSLIGSSFAVDAPAPSPTASAAGIFPSLAAGVFAGIAALLFGSVLRN